VKTLTVPIWRELFDMPETNSLVKIVTNILFKAYREEIEEEVMAKAEAKVMAEKLEIARKLLEESSLTRSKILQLFGLTDEELKAAEKGSA
jgi:hypothetical protein